MHGQREILQMRQTSDSIGMFSRSLDPEDGQAHDRGNHGKNDEYFQKREGGPSPVFSLSIHGEVSD